MIFRFDISPMAAPTIVASDKWKHRPVVMRYYGYRDSIRYQANLKGLITLPGCIESLVFNLPMPASWSKKKQDEMRGSPHEQRPDIDNILRGFLNTFGEDCHISCINSMCKCWSEFGSIELEVDQDQEEAVNYGSNIYREM